MIPAPRDDLHVTPHAEGLHLADGLTRQSVALGPQSAAIWQALQAGHRTPEALAAALPHFTPARLRARLRQLANGCLLADDRFEAQRGLLGGQRPEPLTMPPPRLPTALRHACVRCGSSCTAVQPGPVPPATVRAVTASGAWEAVEGVDAPEALFEAPGGVPLMARRGEACVAVEAGGCALQTSAGDAVKPPSCHQFPYVVAHTPDGPRVGVQLECRQLLASLDAGAALDAATEAATQVRWAAQAGTAFPAPDPVQLAPGLFLPLTTLMVAWDALVGAEAGLAEARQMVGELIDAREEELPAQPWLDAAHWGDAPPPELRPATEALWAAVAEACDEGAQAAEQLHQPWTAARFARAGRVARTIDLPSPVIREAAGVERLRRVAALGELAGLDPLRRRDLLWGIGRLALLLQLAEGWARNQAAEAARAMVLSQDFNDGLVVASMVLRSPWLEQALGVHAATVRWRFGLDGGPWRPCVGSPI